MASKRRSPYRHLARAFDEIASEDDPGNAIGVRIILTALIVILVCGAIWVVPG